MKNSKHDDVIEDNPVESSKIIIKAERKFPDGMQMDPDRVGSITIDAEGFFTDNNEYGYTSKADFLSLLYSLQLGELIALERALDRMYTGQEIGTEKGCRTDDRNRTYIRYVYEENGAEYELKLYYTDAMDTFFMLYSCYILVCDVTLEQLYREALTIIPSN